MSPYLIWKVKINKEESNKAYEGENQDKLAYYQEKFQDFLSGFIHLIKFFLAETLIIVLEHFLMMTFEFPIYDNVH